MIITLIGWALLAVAIILGFVKKRKSWNIRDTIELIQYPSYIIGGLLAFVATIFIIFNAIYCELEYQNVLHERDMLEYRIEHMEENITGNEMLYNDIVEFNNELRQVKKWVHSPWTNWFNNRYVASLDYIELDND